MPLFFFFVNRPATIIPYVICELYILLVTLFRMQMFPFDFLIISYGFTLWYTVYLIKYYLFDKNPENKFEIMSVELIKLSHYLSRFLMCQGSVIAALFIIFYVTNFHTAPVVFFFIFTCIAYMILTESIVAKFVSEALKANIQCKNMNIQNLYEQVRMILVKNI